MTNDDGGVDRDARRGRFRRAARERNRYRIRAAHGRRCARSSWVLERGSEAAWPTPCPRQAVRSEELNRLALCIRACVSSRRSEHFFNRVIEIGYRFMLIFKEITGKTWVFGKLSRRRF